MFGRFTMRSSGVLLALACGALVLCAGCGGDAGDVPLEGAEPRVAARIREARAGIEREPESAAAWGRLGLVYDANGFTPEAVPCYERAGELDPSEWRWPYFAGVALLRNDRGTARRQLELAATRKPDYPPAHFYLGLLALEAGDLDGARERFRRALELDPGFVDALLGLARVAHARGAGREALGFVDEALRLAPGESAVHLHLAEIYRLLEQPERAAHAALVGRSSPIPARNDGFGTLSDPVRDEALQQAGVSSARLRENGLRLLAAGRVAQAVAELQQAVQANPDFIDLRLDLVRALAASGAVEETVAEAERARSLDPNSAIAHARIGEALALAGRRDEGLAALERALELDPNLNEARANLGALLGEMGRVEEGIELLRAASAALPGNPDVFYDLAALLARAGRMEEAVAAAQALLETHPRHAPGHVLLGTLHAMSGRPEESVEALRHALELHPDDPDARIELGRSLWDLGRHAEAIAAFGAAAERRPDDVELTRELAWALATAPDARVRDGQRALVLAQRLCERSRFSDPTHLETLAAAQAATGAFASAADTAGRALAIVERTLAGLAPADTARRKVLVEFGSQLRARQARYRGGAS